MENIKNKVKKLLEEMTLVEKIGQLTQFGKVDDDTTEKIRGGKIGSLLNVYSPQKVNELQRIAVEESRLRIPLLIGDDVIHGFKTIFPIPLALASSWNPELAERSSQIAAKEAESMGIRWTFAPMIDVTRDPRWGRIAECFGEDKLLNARFGAKSVEGFQTKNNQGYPTLSSCAKHYLAYGGVEGGRDYDTVEISNAKLRNYVLPPFKACVEAGVHTVMVAFNEINGIPASLNKWTIREILKNEMDFNGFVVSDWGSIQEAVIHGIAENNKEAAYLGITSGVDMDMHSGVYEENLEELAKQYPEILKMIDDAVSRILTIKYELGLFENPYVDEKSYKDILLNHIHRNTALEAAEESIVLLKNEENILPLSKQKKYAIIGPLADDQTHPLGCWAWKGDPKDVISVLNAVKTKVVEKNVSYAMGCPTKEMDTSQIQHAVSIAKQSEVIIAVVGEEQHMSGEHYNRAYLDLPGSQLDLLKELKKLNKPMVVLVLSGRPLVLNWLDENVDAILQCWHLGVESGNAIANILFGDQNPSGKLPVTFPRAVGQIPIYYNHKNTGRPSLFDKYIDIPETPLYPFGFGLSYTKFEYSNFKIESSKITLQDTLKLTVDVKNVGEIPGKEVVQLYFRDPVASLTRPVKELLDFKKIQLSSGETQTVEFLIKPEQLGFYDNNHQFNIEKGMIKLWVSSDSTGTLEKEIEII